MKCYLKLLAGMDELTESKIEGACQTQSVFYQNALYNKLSKTLLLRII